MLNIEEWHLEEREFGKVTGTGTTKKLKVWVPKIMPFIPFANPKTKLVALNKTCYINGKKCKPKVSSKVKTVYYITIPHDNMVNGKEVKKGTKVTIHAKNGSPDQLIITHDRFYK